MKRLALLVSLIVAPVAYAGPGAEPEAEAEAAPDAEEAASHTAPSGASAPQEQPAHAAAQLAADEAERAGTAYRIGPRDVLSVEVYGEPDCTREVAVSESGAVTLPYIGEVPVGGRTVQEVTDDVRARYLDGILLNPEVAVTVKEHRSKPFQVVGAVKKPGVYYLDRAMAVREAISGAGWIETEKSSRQVSVRRSDGQQVVLSIDELAGERGDLVVQPGDVISVEEGQWVYISGEVENAGEIVYYDGLTVWRALVKAGGPAETARLRKAYLVREDGERIQVNLKRIRDNKEPDVLMKPGDRLVVHESPL